MESVNIPKTQRRLTELEKEELKKIKDAILNSGVTVETATKENNETIFINRRSNVYTWCYNYHYSCY